MDHSAAVNSLASAPEPGRCPYYSPCRGLCQAAASVLLLEPRQKLRRCLSDEFDDCPLFLCRLLRASRWHDYARQVGQAER